MIIAVIRNGHAAIHGCVFFDAFEDLLPPVGRWSTFAGLERRWVLTHITIWNSVIYSTVIQGIPFFHQKFYSLMVLRSEMARIMDNFQYLSLLYRSECYCWSMLMCVLVVLSMVGFVLYLFILMNSKEGVRVNSMRKYLVVLNSKGRA